MVAKRHDPIYNDLSNNNLEWIIHPVYHVIHLLRSDDVRVGCAENHFCICQIFLYICTLITLKQHKPI